MTQKHETSLHKDPACHVTRCQLPVFACAPALGHAAWFCEQHHSEALQEDSRNRSAIDAIDLRTLGTAPAAGLNPKDAIARLKPGLGRVPPGPLYAVAKAMDDGARKYGAFNWRGTPVLASVYHDACKRHLDQWFHGKDHAADSGVHHLAHAAACLMIMLDAEQQGTLTNDRPQQNVPLDDIVASMAAQEGAPL